MLKIDVTETARILDILSNLHADNQAFFGMMTPQHMVEHLILTLQISTEKITKELMFPPEIAQKIRYAVIVSENELPVGFKAPFMLKEELMPLEQANLQSAIEKLGMELTYFIDFFDQHPDKKTINPSMGELNFEEWLIFHRKHFTHHFKQFGLV
jgi:hypothetical protein